MNYCIKIYNGYSKEPVEFYPKKSGLLALGLVNQFLLQVERGGDKGMKIEVVVEDKNADS